MFVKTLSKIRKDDTKEVGGKGASLGEMKSAGIPVPDGFVVTTNCFRRFLNEPFSAELEVELKKAFDELRTERVAVRSSAVAEDSKTASWAGQLESYLNVSREGLIEAIRQCWSSIRSERALSYAAQQSIDEEDLVVAVVVQKMINSEVSGVMFTVNPVTRNKTQMMIEACFGLGEMIVQGMVTPDNYLINKETQEIIESSANSQDRMLVFEDGQNREVDVPVGKTGQLALSTSHIEELSRIGLKIEQHYGVPQDIEWALEKGQFYVVQSRPITTL